MSQSFAQTLKGVGEIFVFMPLAIERFSPLKSDALKSFAFPLFFYPWFLLAFTEKNAVADVSTMLVHFLLTFGGMLLFYAIIWWLTIKTDRRDGFWLFVHVANCQSILMALIYFAIVLPFGLFAPDFEQRYIFIIFADIVYTAFIATHVLRLPWAVGGFLSIVNLLIGDVTFRLIMATHGLIA